MNRELKLLRKLKKENKEIKVAIVGVGKMGSSLFKQLLSLDGFKVNIIVNRTIEKAKKLFIDNNINNYDCPDSFEKSEKLLEKDYFVYTDDISYVYKSEYIDVIVDATGSPEAGAEIAYNSIINKKHIVMLNVECDATIGPILRKLAMEEGVVYTGTKGDEPGSIIDLVEFANRIGLEVLVCGKGKNNELNQYAKNEDLIEKAKKAKVNTRMMTSFVDGTNTMIEMNSLGNAIGFKVDKAGMHGINTDLKNSSKDFSLKSQGGVLDSYKVVDFAFGMSPGVFLIGTSDDENVRDLLTYLQLGEGPNYTLYRPFHLTSLETPITIYEAVIENNASISAEYGQVLDTVVVAKRDLNKGENPGYIGSNECFGLLVNREDRIENNYVPIGLLNSKAVLTKDLKKGEFLTYDMVSLDKDSYIYKLRKKQEELGL